MECSECGSEKFTWDNVEMQTLLGWNNEPGHNHDPNCRKRTYTCENGHPVVLSVRNRCPKPGCDWRGKTECFCHKGPKVDYWPGEEPEGP